jgi:Concanavalin A-like lectin/glucanases superfamily
MPQLGLGLGSQFSTSSLYDGDAISYFNRAGIGSDSLTPSAYDAAASFNGTNQALTISNNSTIQLAGTNFTLAAWINLTSLAAGDRVILAKNVSGVVADYVMAINSSGQLKFARNNAGWEVYSTTATVSLNTWAHCAIVLSGLNITFYINGTSSGTATLSSGVANQTGGFAIGQYGEETGVGLFLGQIGPCAIWKRALSSGEITNLYNSGYGTTYASLDSSIKTNLVSWWSLNATSVTADSNGSNALTNNNSITATKNGPIVTEYTSSRTLINNFVKGIKDLGLWSNMVCWPLRSAQNKGSGSTVYSLGGLGTYNGTLNGTSLPTWGTNGLTNTSDGLVRTSFPWSTTHSGLAVYNQSSTAGLQTIFQFGDALGGTANGRRSNVRLDANLFLYNGSYNSYGFGPTSLNAFKMAGYGVISGSSLLGYNDGSTSTISASPVSLAGGTSTNNFVFLACAGSTGGGNDSPVQFFVGSSAFASAFNIQLSSGQYSSLYSLYKTTLGKGIGLP